MVTGRVVGNVWSTRRIAELPAGALLEVVVDGDGERIVALDVLGSGVGERVLVTRGAAAASWFATSAPVDALIVGSVDETQERDGRPAGATVVNEGKE
jgi:ethanolamine utilization protein EutN